VRRIADVDHFVPLIALLLDSGVSAKNIRYKIFVPHLSLIGIDSDYRTQHLASRNISLEKVCAGLFREDYSPGKKNRERCMLTKDFACRLRKLCWRPRILSAISSVFLGSTILTLLWGSKRNGTLIIEQSTSIQCRLIAKIAKLLAIRVVGFRIGVTLCRSVAAHDVDEVPRLLEVFDELVLQNDVGSYLKTVQDQGRVHITGSLRYSSWWLERLSEIATKSNVGDKEAKLLYVLDKGDKEDWQAILDLIERFGEIRKLHVLIKGHPRSPRQNLPVELGKRHSIEWFPSDEAGTTLDLIRSSNVVVGTGTAAILDAFVLEKPILIPAHHSKRELVFDKYGFPGFVWSDEEGVQFLTRVIGQGVAGLDNPTLRSYQRVIQDVILANGNPAKELTKLLT